MAHDNPDDPQSTDVSSDGGIVLPSETIYHILCFLDPLDLIRLQSVSKRFQTLIHEPALWRTIYATARHTLLLPPGPFAWQSARILQRALVKSAQLAQTWATAPLTLLEQRAHPASQLGLRLEATDDVDGHRDQDRCRWVCGRWLVVVSGETRETRTLRVHDVETGANRVIWDHSQGAFAGWSTTAVVAPQGRLLFVVVHLERGRLADPVKLLEFVADEDTGHLSDPETFDVPVWALSREAFIPRVRIVSGFAPYVYISLDASQKPRQSLVFDPQRRQFYRFPRFRTRLDLLLNYPGAWLPHLIEVYFTRTHIFVLSRSYLLHGNLGDVELIQTFALPDADPHLNSEPNPGLGPEGDSTRPIVRKLRLTHETITHDTRSTWLTPIRDAIVYPATGLTTLRFMHTYAPLYPTPDMRIRFAYTDYILSTSASTSPTDATPSNDNDNDRDDNSDDGDGLGDRNLNAIVRSTDPVQHIMTISHDLFSIPGRWCGNLVDVSREGLVRGLSIVCPPPSAEAEGTPFEDEIDRIHKFTVDATGDGCLAVVGEPSSPWPDLDTHRHYDFAIDGMRGKLWYTLAGTADEHVYRDVLAIVADFK